MKKISRRLISLFMSVLMLFGTVSTVYAADTTYKEYGIETDSAQTEVTLEVEDSEILVSVPKTVIVSGTRDCQDNLFKGFYGVSVEGDWSGSKIVSVTPDETVELNQKGKKPVTADITQDKTTWQVSETDTVANGVVSADKLSAGSWEGTFNFNINIEEGIPDGYTVLYKYDLSATSNDDVAAYYCVPNENTRPVSQNKNITASMSSLFSPMVAYAADNNIVEHDGMIYELSDDDTFIISGNGDMKESICDDLYNLEGISELVSNHYTVDQEYYKEWYESNHPYRTFVNAKLVRVNVDCFGTINGIAVNSYNEYGSAAGIIYINHIPKDAILDLDGNPVTIEDMQAYVDTIKDDYIVSLPKTVIIRDGVTNISKSAFDGCKSLETIEIGNTVKTIDERAFALCKALKSVKIPNNVETIGSSAFTYSGVESAIIGDGIKIIGTNAFGNCTSLKNVDLGNTVEEIGSAAFGECSIEQIHVPATVKKIGSTAFSDIKVGATVRYDGTVNDWAQIYFQNEYATLTSHTEFYCQNKKVTDMVIDVDTVSAYAFYSLRNLKSVSFTKNVKNIGERAFYNTGITELVVPETIERLDLWCFSNNYQLKKLDLRTTTTEGGGHTFEWCTVLEDVQLPDGLTRIRPYMFEMCKLLRRIDIPETVTSIGDDAFWHCDSLEEFVVPKSVKSIGSAAFGYCGMLQKFSIPDGIESIGTGVFSSSALFTNEDNWDNGALYIDNALIKVNENIAESYQIKNGTKIIANGAFDRNKVVTDVVIPNTVEHIGEKAFYSCSYLENIYIPNSVKSVGASAFTSILKGSTIYCESQEVADMLTGYYSTTRTSVVVDSTKF